MDSNNRPQSLILRGTVIRILPIQEGVSKAGNNWRRQSFVIETEAQYPRTVCFQIWNDRIDTYPVQEGDYVDVRFDIESREFNERWYTDATAYDIAKVERQAAPSAQGDPFAGRQPYAPSEQTAQVAGGYATRAPEAAEGRFGGSFDPNAAEDSADDLPF